MGSLTAPVLPVLLIRPSRDFANKSQISLMNRVPIRAHGWEERWLRCNGDFCKWWERFAWQ